MKKNELYHAVIKENAVKENTITGDPELARRLQYKTGLREAAGKGDSDANRRLANHEYYEQHKAWKKAYNAEYYQKNKEYWQNMYKFNKDVAEARGKMADETKAEADTVKNKYGENSELYKKKKDIADANQEWYNNNLADIERSKMNLQKANEAMKWYTRNTSSTPISTLWKTGAKSIVDSGKKALSSFASLFKSGLKSIFG